MSFQGFLGMLLTFLLGLSVGMNVGQWRMAIATDRLTRAWQEEMQMRNTVAEGALNLLADSKYQITAAKAEAARKLRNVQDGRK